MYLQGQLLVGQIKWLCLMLSLANLVAFGLTFLTLVFS